jgi:hypothetical protein
MLWHKAWLETRSRFFIGLAILTIMAFGMIPNFRATERIAAIARVVDSPAIDASGSIGAAIKEGFETQRTFRGFVWYQWYRGNLSNLMTLFAALLGAGGLLSKAGGGAAAFTLSLPITRPSLIGVRAGVGLAQLFVFAFLPSLVLPLFAPGIGQSYSILDVAVHGACIFAVGAVFFSLATLLSTELADIWQPMLVTCLAAVVLAMCEYVPALSPFGLFRIMSAATYFRQGSVPWIGLLVCIALSGALLRAAATNLARRDF